MHKKELIIVCGPTASGKSGFFEQLCKESQQTLECINADTGQMYKELSIGTAKPNLSKTTNPEFYHLFDSINFGQFFSACQFRQKTEKLCQEIWDRGNKPVVVGGSMFYIASLFFPQKEPISKINLKSEKKAIKKNVETWSNDQLYQELNKIDPERAAQIMPNDRYRLIRALEIFEEFGVKPSELSPEFNPVCQNIDLIFLCPERTELDQRIRNRLKTMLQPTTFSAESGWIEEVEGLLKNKQAVDFILKNRLIGYSQIINWLENKEKKDISELEETLFLTTRDYSRKQIKFWKNLKRKLDCLSNSAFLRIYLIENPAQRLIDPSNDSIFEKN